MGCNLPIADALNRTYLRQLANLHTLTILAAAQCMDLDHAAQAGLSLMMILLPPVC